MVLPRVTTDKTAFKDKNGRTVLLRGVNLGGDCKVPYKPDGSTHLPTDFANFRDVSFIGRPFPLEQAQEHFNRLRSWGFNCLRLLTTWEALEHKAPGMFDRAYIDYFVKLVDMAHVYGFYVFIDFHQDVWSRMSGGDGAPGWVFEKVGIDYSKLNAANAAIVMQQRINFEDKRAHQEENYPTMCWSQNYRYAANAIMWTLFFGGKDFAPNFKVDGMNIQDYLQKHYLDSMLEIAKRVKDFPNVLGFDSLNEPSAGWIGINLNDRHLHSEKNDPALPGIAWSPIDALYSSYGRSILVPKMELSILRGGFYPKSVVPSNPKKISIWLPNKTDPFLQAGAWALMDNSFSVFKPDYFQKVGDRSVDFDRDYMFPFINRVAESVRKVNPQWLMFAEKDATKAFFHPDFPAQMPDKVVNATHWYDGAILGKKKFFYPIALDILTRKPVFGTNGIQKMYEGQLKSIMDASAKVNQGIPTLIGEFGIPFDLDDGKAFRLFTKGKRSPKIWGSHNQALDIIYNAFDSLFLSGTQWNYTASNRNDLRIGDGWNQEDFSIYSMDQKVDPADVNSGGRALDAVVRPFARFVQGVPVKMQFDRQTGVFQFSYRANPALPEPTEIYIPKLQYPNGYIVIAEGTEIIRDEAHQMVYLRANSPQEIRVIVHRKK